MKCPVCGSATDKVMLRMEKCPLFQYPVAPDAEVEPISADLEFLFCERCGHAFQRLLPTDLLAKLYESFYFVPGVENVCVSLRNEFLGFFTSLALDIETLLEIGCSSGELLVELRKMLPGVRFRGVEPNVVNSCVCREKGFDVEAEFFTEETVRAHGRHYDAIVARNLIEHLEDFDDFFRAIESVAHERTRLILETPSLDYFIKHQSLDPFHVEHAHVFCLNSLGSLCGRYGWGLRDYSGTSFGGNIAVFERGPGAGKSFAVPRFDQARRIYDRVECRRKAVLEKIEGRHVLAWGAGSCGRSLITLYGIEPEAYLDSNPNKDGYRYVGIDIPVRHAQATIEELIRADRDRDYVMLITSGYYKEISEALAAAGWRGAVVIPSLIG